MGRVGWGGVPQGGGHILGMGGSFITFVLKMFGQKYVRSANYLFRTISWTLEIELKQPLGSS